MPTQIGTFIAAGNARYCWAMPSPGESLGLDVLDLLRERLPSPSQNLLSELEDDVRKGKGPWFLSCAQEVDAQAAAREALKAEAAAAAPRFALVVKLAQWTRNRNLSGATSHIVAERNGALRIVEIGEALVAEPYVEDGPARRAMFREAPAVVGDYLASDQHGGSAQQWREWFREASGALHIDAREVDRTYSSATAAEWAECDSLPQANYRGYILVDRTFNAHIDESDATALAGWLEAEHAALRGQGHREVRWHYYGPQSRRGARVVSWVEQLRSLPWVRCADGSLRTPAEVLSGPDPAREDAPVASLSQELVATLVAEGVQFGERIPAAPAIRRLSRLGKSLGVAEHRCGR